MMNDVIEQLIADMKKKEEFRDNITYSTDYIDWLEQFTAKNGSFANDSFLYDSKDLTEEDMKRVDEIELFFEVIHDYAEANFIYPKKVDFGAYYSIQHNGIGYNIGMDHGQGGSFYCTRLEKPVEGSLEFKHVMSSVKLPETILAEFQLEQLVALIEKLNSESVPITAIQQTVEHTIQKIKKRNEEKNKRT